MSRSPRRARLCLLVAIAAGTLSVFICGASAAAAPRSSGTVLLTVVTPPGVPANVVLRGNRTRVLSKAPKPRRARFKLAMRPGWVLVRSPIVTFNGSLYAAPSEGRSVQVWPRRTLRIRLVYSRLAVASRLRATTVEETRVVLSWDDPAGRDQVQLRRIDGARLTVSVRDGVKVATTGTSASDRGLRLGSKYTYALFTRIKRRWVGPVTIAVGTASADPSIAAYVAPPTTVLVKPGTPDRPQLTPGGVDVALARDQPTPVIGAGFVLPVSAALPGGFLGRVASVSADGRTVHLVAGGLADAFDFYKINADLSDVGPITLNHAASTARAPDSRSRPQAHSAGDSCLGGSLAGEVVLHPIVQPSGHFSSSLIKRWGLPVGAQFDVSAQLKLD
jgi:hypothetical protein